MTPQTLFTPGPWAATPTAIIEHDYKATIRTAHSNVCSVIGATSRSRSEFDANARLIASAPSLYAALQALLESFPVRDEAAYWEKRISEEPELMLEPEELALMEAVNAARKALAMGSGGELGSSTPR